MAKKKEKNNFFKNNQKLIIICSTILASIIIIAITLIAIFSNHSSGGVGKGGITKEKLKNVEVGKTTTSTINRTLDPDGLWHDNAIFNKVVSQVEKVFTQDKIYRYVNRYEGEKSGYALITFEADYSRKGAIFEVPVVTKIEEHDLK